MPRTSRLYAGAAYFRGLIAARPGRLSTTPAAPSARSCPADGGAALAFNIDGRYFQLQDLARLALGRIAHEQDRYDEAYYFYFSVPEDSERLAEALFEAAWSMYQKGEVRAARAFVEASTAPSPTRRCGPRWRCCGRTSPCAPAPSTAPGPRRRRLVATYEPLQKRVARGGRRSRRWPGR